MNLAKLQGVDPVTINVAAVAPDRPLPEWIGKFREFILRHPLLWGAGRAD